jgi:hypothetical protein
MLNRKKVDKGFERRFLIGLIVSDQFIRTAESIYKPEFITSQPAQVVAQWCFNFAKKYNMAPKANIQGIFESNEEKLDPDIAEQALNLLGSLNEEVLTITDFNVDFLLDETQSVFNAISLENLAKTIKTHLSQDNVVEALEAHAQYAPIEIDRTKEINPFTDEEAIRNAFEQATEPIFKLPGALGQIMNPQLVPASFVAFLAPEKRGKTFWLQELAMRAFFSRENVAIFDLGDMTLSQRICRLHSYLAKRPLEKYARREPVRFPVLDCYMNQDDTCEREDRESKVGCYDKGIRMAVDEAVSIGYKPCSICSQIRGTVWYEMRLIEPITWRDAVKNGEKLMTRIKGRGFKMKCFENSSVNIRKGINNQLLKWKNDDGFIPKVIVLDYIDIASAEESAGSKEYRHQVNNNWKAARWLSQHWDACVITATQADADSYEQTTIGLSNFSEDKRKYGHVTAMYSLNQTDVEKNDGILRVGELLVREGGFDRLRQVHVLECRHIGRPLLASYF